MKRGRNASLTNLLQDNNWVEQELNSIIADKCNWVFWKKNYSATSMTNFAAAMSLFINSDEVTTMYKNAAVEDSPPLSQVLTNVQLNLMQYSD